MDRRISRTRRLLGQALVDLISTQSYAKITIRDITEHADIGYATFFRHYTSKDDLMLALFTQIIAELEAHQDNHLPGSFADEGQQLFQHVAEFAPLYRGILESIAFTRKLRDHMAIVILGHLNDHANDIAQPAIPLAMAAHHMVSSVLGLIDWWLTNGQLPNSKKMGDIYERLIIRATWFAMIPENEMPFVWER